MQKPNLPISFQITFSQNTKFGDCGLKNVENIGHRQIDRQSDRWTDRKKSFPTQPEKMR
jgi:hypothetical protein